MIEGEGKLPLTEGAKKISEDVYCVTHYFSSNLTPKIMIKMIFNLLKRVVVFRMFEAQPEYRRSILQQLYEQKVANMTKEELEFNGDFLKKKYIEMKRMSFSNYEDPRSEITDEICELVRITNYDQVMAILKKDGLFFRHNCFEIAEKLFNLFKVFALESYPFKLSLDQKLKVLKELFTEEGELRDQQKELPEESCILQILLEGRRILDRQAQEVEEDTNPKDRRFTRKEKVAMLKEDCSSL